MKNIINNNNAKGFTLIEILLYLSLAAIMLVVIFLLLSTLLQSRIKNQSIAEVEQQGIQAMQLITQTIRNAEAINSPSQASSSASLSLDVVTSTDDPTIFDNVGNELRFSAGGGDYVPLNNSRVVASGLSFQNLSRNNTPGTLRIQFTLSHVNPEGRNEYNFTKTFLASATLRGVSSPEADGLVIDTSGAILGGGNRNLQGITLENISATNITIDKITVSWTDTSNIERIRIDGVRVWGQRGPGTPAGVQPSGTELDIQDFVLTPGLGIININDFRFDTSMTGNTFAIIFTMTDGSQASVSGIAL